MFLNKLLTGALVEEDYNTGMNGLIQKFASSYNSGLVNNGSSEQRIKFAQAMDYLSQGVTYAGDLILLCGLLEKSINGREASELAVPALVVGGVLFATGLISNYFVMNKYGDHESDNSEKLQVDSSDAGVGYSSISRHRTCDNDDLEEAVDYWC